MTKTLIEMRPGTYTIDPARSQLRFTAHEFFGRREVPGEMPVRSGTLTVATEPRHSTVSAEVDATGWSTGNPRRDGHVRGKRYLDTDRHPAIGFRSTRVTGGPDAWVVTGVLSVRGGSAEVDLAITAIEPAVDGSRITATGRVDRIAAGVAAGRGLIGRYLEVELTLTVTAG